MAKKALPKPSRTTAAATSGRFSLPQADLLQLARDTVALATRGGASAAEVDVSEGFGQSVSVRQGEVETIEYNRDKGIGVTVYLGQRKGYASTSDFSRQALAQTVDAALAIARYTAEDPCAGLPEKALLAKRWQDPQLYYPWQLSVEGAIDLARRPVAEVMVSPVPTVSPDTELRRVAALTGLFGRGHWQEQAEAALRSHHTTDEPACMLMLDIDHFKEINDAYGHTVGDEVIRALAHVVRGNVRAGDCAGRYGGDEFAIVLPGMHARDALAIAQRIREQTEGVRLRSLPELRITSSIGVAPADHRHSSLRAWIDAADAALYVAKNGGRNQVAGCMEPALVPAV